MKEKRKRKKEEFHFSGRHHSKLGMISMIGGVATWSVMICLSLIASSSYGNADVIIGAIGISLLVLSGFGFVMAYTSTKEKDIYYRYPIAGMLLHGLLLIFLLALYIIGIWI